MLILMGDGRAYFFNIVKCYLVPIYLYKFEHYQIHHKHGVTCYVLYLWVNSYEGGKIKVLVVRFHMDIAAPI